jgi:hypothetical protein
MQLKYAAIEKEEEEDDRARSIRGRAQTARDRVSIYRPLSISSGTCQSQ